MADNVTTKHSDAELLSNSETTEPKTGWLLKRTKTSRKWKKKWFVLKEKSLFYGNTQDEMSKSITLNCCEITSCEMAGKTNSFSLRPKDTGRKHFICAESETELQEWMQAICLAKAVGQKNGEGTQACVIQ